jgi:hypothetical protein
MIFLDNLMKTIDNVRVKRYTWSRTRKAEVSNDQMHRLLIERSRLSMRVNLEALPADRGRRAGETAAYSSDGRYDPPPPGSTAAIPLYSVAVSFSNLAQRPLFFGPCTSLQRLESPGRCQTPGSGCLSLRVRWPARYLPGSSDDPLSPKLSSIERPQS